MSKNVKLTNYRKYMVEKFYSLSNEITVEEYCNKYSVDTLHLEDFIKWIELYENSAGKITLKKSYNIQPLKKKNIQRKIQPKMQSTNAYKEKRDELKCLYQTNRIKNYKTMVKKGRVKFSDNKKDNSVMCNMYLCDDDPSKIYKLALLLAETLVDYEFEIRYLQRLLNRQLMPNINNKKDLKRPGLNSFLNPSTVELDAIAFEIDPSSMKIEKVGIHE
ncbi:MAG: hypothetical protein OWP43_10955 [Sphaerochaetaceae bacterium]|nr:hypothetical protein [Sphaerochaetaceae bacterium]